MTNKPTIITKTDISSIRDGLKSSLNTLRQNYIPGAPIAPKGTEIENCTVVNMYVRVEDIEHFSLAMFICDAVENIVFGEYNTKDVLYLLDAENKLSKYLSSVEYKYNFLPMGVETPDRYFLKATKLMCSRIRDNLEIKVKL